jgi:CheY-like chemotaxis protein
LDEANVSASSFNILLIDDSQAEAKLFELALHEAAPRAKLYWVATATEGFEYLRQEGRFPGTGPISIVVCDLNMPGPSGFDFVAQMKKDPRLMPIPLIVWSASEAPQDIHRAYSLGVNSYLVKSMTMDTMIQQLEVLVRFWFDTARLASARHLD